MSRLSTAGGGNRGLSTEPRKQPKIKLGHVIVVSLVSILLILFTLVVVSSAFYLSERSGGKESVLVNITTTTPPTTSSTTSLPETTIPTTIPVTSTTLYTTTTISCGGDYEEPCIEGGKKVCGKGRVLGSDFLCKPVKCAPTVPSGKSGCGAFALNWCKS